MPDLSFGTTDSHILEDIVSSIMIPDFIDEIMEEFDDSRIGPGSWLRPTEVLALKLKNQPYGLRPLRVEGYDPLDPNPNQGAMWWGAFEKELAKHHKSLAPILVQKIWDELPLEIKKKYFTTRYVKTVDMNPADMYTWRVGYPSRPYVANTPLSDVESVTNHNRTVSLPAELRSLTPYEVQEILPPIDPKDDPTYIGDVSIDDLADPNKGVQGIVAPLFGAPYTGRKDKPKYIPSGGFHTDPPYVPGSGQKVEVKELSVEADLRIRRFLDTKRHAFPEPERDAIVKKPPKVTRRKKQEKIADMTGVSVMAKLLLRKK